MERETIPYVWAVILWVRNACGCRNRSEMCYPHCHHFWCFPSPRPGWACVVSESDWRTVNRSYTFFPQPQQDGKGQFPSGPIAMSSTQWGQRDKNGQETLPHCHKIIPASFQAYTVRINSGYMDGHCSPLVSGTGIGIERHGAETDIYRLGVCDMKVPHWPTASHLLFGLLICFSSQPFDLLYLNLYVW